MPEGPFGFPRLTNTGPLTRNSDMEVAGEFIDDDAPNKEIEADIRRTTIDMDNVTGAGRPDVYVYGTSILMKRGVTGEYNGDVINVSYEAPYSVSKDSKYESFLKGLLAHEYVHFALEQKSAEQVVESLHSRGLFIYNEIDHVTEYYSFPPEQYVEYNSRQEFIDHLEQFDWHDPARPLEGLANIVAARYARVSFSEYSSLKESVKENATEYSQEVLMGETGSYTPRESWRVTW